MKLEPQEYYHLPYEQAKLAAFNLIQPKSAGFWASLEVNVQGHFSLDAGGKVNIRTGWINPAAWGIFIGCYNVENAHLDLFDCWELHGVDYRANEYQQRYRSLASMIPHLPKWCSLIPSYRIADVEAAWNLVKAQKSDGLIFRRLSETAADRIAFTKNLQ